MVIDEIFIFLCGASGGCHFDCFDDDRVVAECAEDPDYKTTGCIWPRRIYPVVSIIMKCYLSERISFKEYLDNFIRNSTKNNHFY